MNLSADICQAFPEPASRGKKRLVVLSNQRKRVLLSDFPLFYQPRLLRLNPFQQFRRRFILGVLRDEFAADGKIQDGLPELLDVFGARGEAREMAKMEAGVLAEL